MELYNFNKIQTQLTKELLDSLDKEELHDLYDCIDNIVFIKNLANPDRKYARDLERDSKGRIKIEIENPHILEDMDFFRQPAIHFQTHGVYTLLYPNSNPNSEYYQYWKEERRRCREGLIRESDGEWIPGYFYYYLNYSPIMVVEAIEGRMSRRTREFPDLYDGDYLYFHYIQRAREEGSHGSILKRRGVGASFKGAAMLGRNFVIGEKEDRVGVKDATSSFAIANEKEYLTKDGILNKFIDNIDWCALHTPFPRIRELKDSMNEMHWKMGYKDKELGIERGSGNEVMGVTLKNDPQKARGKRGSLVLWEESGKFSKLLTAWNVARESMEEGRFTFGIMLNFGTGGTEGADFLALQEMFYNPRGYNICALKNVFDKNVDDGSECSFFFGAYLNRKGYYDHNGNSDVIGALIEVIKDRIYVKRHANDPSALVQRKAENPITPQEAVLIVGMNIFPVSDVKEYLSYIKPNLNKFTGSHYVGELVSTVSGNVEWRDKDLYPIREYPLTDNLNRKGAIEIYQMPIRNADGSIPRLRYIAGIDTYDDDHSTTNSLGSIFILDTYTDTIVAEYTGRPFLADDFYEICRRLLIFYNATANYENDKKGLYGYFKNKNSLHLLCDNPQILEDKNMANIRENYGNKKKGTNSSTTINAWGRSLQASWLIKDAWGTGGMDDEGNVLASLMNLQVVRSIAYLEEIVKYNSEGNFDRISAMGMLMIYREEIYALISRRGKEQKKSIVDDDFFSRHVKNKYNEEYNHN
jgi:predicted house-cleaning noncanonical NTP pyrophosphatase (MazG superfamily)